MDKTRFKDRKEAGLFLAKELSKYKENSIILGLPRGGVAVAKEVSNELGIPLDVLVIKKVGVPGNSELALGAVGTKDYILNQDLVDYYKVTEDFIQENIKIKQDEAKELYSLLRGTQEEANVNNKVVIIIDDGIATGATIGMAIQIIKKQKPNKIIVAVPVGPIEAIEKLKQEVDEVICLIQPPGFMAIGEYYEDFTQVTSEEAKRMLE